MINKKVFGLLKQYTTHMVSFDFAMDSIKDILGSTFDEDEWMDLTQCILMVPDCFSDMVSRIDRFSLGPSEGGSKRGRDGSRGGRVLARGTRSCT